MAESTIKRLCASYTVTFDPRSGRLAIPSRHRKSIPEGQRDELYVTRGFEHCIYAYYNDSWQKFKEKITDERLSKKKLNALQREFIGRLNQVTFDKQGRITINSDLIEWAQLQNESEVKIVGCGDKLEIWNIKLHQDNSEKNEEHIQDFYDNDYT